MDDDDDDDIDAIALHHNVMMMVMVMMMVVMMVMMMMMMAIMMMKKRISRCGGAVYQAEQVLTRAGPCHLLCLSCNNCRSKKNWIQQFGFFPLKDLWALKSC